MQKSALLKQLKKLDNSTVLSIYLLKQFLKTDRIQQLGKNDEVSFRDYINFIQKDHLNVAELFTEPYLTNSDFHERALLDSYSFRCFKEERPLVSNNIIKFKLRNLATIEGLSALMAMPDGSILLGTNKFEGRYGALMLFNPLSKEIKTLAESEGISAIARTSDGNILVGTSQYCGCYGKLKLYDPSGKQIKTLTEDDGICAIASMPNGNILLGTSRYNDSDGKLLVLDPSSKEKKILASGSHGVYAINLLPNGNILVGTSRYKYAGKVIFHNPSGKEIETLEKGLGVSAIAVLPDGNFLLGTRNLNGHYGELILCDSSGKEIKTLVKDEDVSGIKVMPDGSIIIGTYRTNFGGLKVPVLTEIKERPQFADSWLLQRIHESLLVTTTNACIQFHKGVKNPNEDVSLLCRLPEDLLKVIYSYVFPFPHMETNVVVNPNCFPYQTDKDVKKVLLANEFAKKICQVKFFSQPESKKTNEVSHINEDKKQRHHHKSKKCHLM